MDDQSEREEFHSAWVMVTQRGTMGREYRRLRAAMDELKDEGTHLTGMALVDAAEARMGGTQLD